MSKEAEQLHNRKLGESDGETVWTSLYDDGDVLIQYDGFGAGIVFEPEHLAKLVELMEAGEIPSKKWAALGTDTNENVLRVASEGDDFTFVWDQSETSHTVELPPELREKFEAFLDDFSWVYE